MFRIFSIVLPAIVSGKRHTRSEPFDVEVVVVDVADDARPFFSFPPRLVVVVVELLVVDGSDDFDTASNLGLRYAATATNDTNYISRNMCRQARRTDMI
jgi:hypothetical protein